MIIDITKRLEERKELYSKNMAIVTVILEAVNMYPNLEFGKILWMLGISKDDLTFNKTTDDFINAYIKEYGETNEFDLIEVHKLIKLSYCLGLKKGITDNH
jgi:hypothetical protein